MKKVLAVFLSIMLVFTMVPTVGFAEESLGWNESYKSKVGDVVMKGSQICSAYVYYDAQTSLQVDVEIQLKNSDAMIPYDYYTKDGNTLRASRTIGADEMVEFHAPVNAIVDNVIYDNNKITYKLHELTKFDGGLPLEGFPVMEGNDLRGIIFPTNESYPLVIKHTFFEDEEHTVPLLVNGVSVDITETMDSPVEITDSPKAPIGVMVDSVSYDEETNTVSVIYHKQLWNSDEFYEMNRVNTVYNKNQEVYYVFRNLQQKTMAVNIVIYEDKTCTNRIEKEGYSYFEEFAPGDWKTLVFKVPENIRYVGVTDATSGINSSLTLKFYVTTADVPAEDWKTLERLENKANDILSNVTTDKINLKIADPSKMNIEGYDKESAKRYINNWVMLAKEFGIQRIFYSEYGENKFEATGTLCADIYIDAAKTEKVESYYDFEANKYVTPIDENKTYYLDVYYTTYVGVGDGVSLSSEVHLDKLIPISYEFVSIGGYETEVEQIKANGNKKFNYLVEDLSWINTLVSSGFDSYLPAVENAEAFLKKQNAKLYSELVGKTKLEVILNYGGGGDHFKFIGDAMCTSYYYADDIYFGYGPMTATRPAMYLSQVLYVPAGTTDRANVAEKRIADYLGDGNFEAEIERILSPDDMLDLWIDSCRSRTSKEETEAIVGEIRSSVKAAYLTKYGVAFYSHETSTTKADFLAGWTICAPTEYASDLFENSQLEEVGTVEYFADEDGYVEERNLKAYAPYKLTLTDKQKAVSEDFLYIIGIGNEEQLKEPYADWKDEETGIVTKGENGYVPFDAHTKIRVIKNGTEIKFIQDKVGDDKKVHAYDINAYTNFKGGKLTDLGDGRMKVMIPLGVLSEDGVKAHYVDEKGNVQDLQYTIEEYEGEKYVCFITNHFSTYAISGVEAQNSGDNSGEEDGKQSVTVETNKIDTTKPVENVEVGIKKEDAAKVESTLKEETTEIIDKIEAGKIVGNIVGEIVQKIETIKEAISVGKDVAIETKVETAVVERKDLEATTEGKKTVARIEKEAGKAKIVQYLDLGVKLEAEVDGQVITGSITELEKPIKFTIAIPTELQKVEKGLKRNFFVLRDHNGKVDKLPTTLNSDGTISFETDRFSTYALAYEDVAEKTPETAPETGDNTFVGGWILMAALSAAGAVVLRRKEDN